MSKSLGWLHRFLESSSRSELRGRPDGRELYRYRTTLEEYAQLKDTLRADLSLGAFVPSAESVHRAFVLFVAEWFKRDYDGSDWSWNLPFEALGSSETERTPPFYEALDRSFRFWGIAVEQGGGDGEYRAWLGTLLRASGLPIKLLAQEGTPFRVAFRNLLEEIERRPFEERQKLATLVFEKTAGIYRHESMLENVLQVVDVLLQNRQLIRLGGRLDELTGTESLPFLVEDQEARNLLGSLVKAAVEAQDRIVGEQFRVVTRALFSAAGDRWEIEREVITPRSSGTKSFVSQVPPLAGEDSDDFPSTGIVSAYAGATRITVADFVQYDDGERLRFAASSDPTFRGEVSLQSISLGVASGGRRRFFTAEPIGPNIEELPWVFGARGVDDQATLVATRGFRTGAAELLVALPPKSDWVSEAPELAVTGGPGGRSLYKIAGQAIAQSLNDDGVWSFATGTQAVETAEFALRGTRRDFFAREVLVGAKLFEGDFQRQAEDAQFVPDGGAPERLSDSSFGVGWVRLRRDGELLFHQRVTLVPSGLKARAELDGHSWVLEGASTRQVTSLPELNIQVKDAAMTRISFDDVVGDATIALAWLGSGSMAFNLPRPERSAVFIGKDGVRLADGAAVALDDLSSLRAIGIDVGGDNEFDLAISFHSLPASVDMLDHGLGKIEMFFPMPRAEALFEADLREVRRKLEILFDSTRSNKAEAKARVKTKPTNIRNAPELKITRYSHHRRPDTGQDFQLEPVGPEGVYCTALRFFNPAREPVVIPARENGNWDLGSLTQVEPGPWIVSVRAHDGLLVAAPTMHNVPGFKAPTSSTLVKAMLESNRDLRAVALRRALEEMASDPEHVDWRLLDEFVGTLEDFPPQTFDAIVELAATPNAAVACVLRIGRISAKRLVERLEDLPFLWCAVPWTSWRLAAAGLGLSSVALEAQVCGQKGLSLRERVGAVNERLDWLRDNCGQRELAEVHRCAKFDPRPASTLQEAKLYEEVQRTCGESVIGRPTVACGLRWSSDESIEVRRLAGEYSASAIISQILAWLDQQKESSPRIEPYVVGPLLCAISAANRHQLEPRYVPFARAARESQPVLFQKLFDLFFLHLVSAEDHR